MKKTLLFIPVLIFALAAAAQAGSKIKSSQVGGVSQITAGNNVTLSPANGQGNVTVSVSASAGVAPGASYYYQIESTGNAINQPKSTATFAAVVTTSLTVNGATGLISVSTGLTVVIGGTTTVSFQGNGNILQNGVLLTAGSSGSGSSNYREIQFQPYSAKLSTGMNAKGAGLVSGTSYFYLSYSADVRNGAQWQGMIPNDYSTTTATVDIDYVAADGITTGNIIWDAFVSTSTISGWGVANSTTVAVHAVSGERARCSVPLSSPNLVAQSWFRLRLDRNADAAGDTLTSSGTVTNVRIRY